MLRFITVGLMALTSIAIGCAEDAPSDQDGATAAARAFAVALLSGDGAAACGHMTSEAQREIARRTSLFIDELTGETQRGSRRCPRAMSLLAAFERGAGPTDGEPEKEAASREMESEADSAIDELEAGGGISDVQVTGDRARVGVVAGLDDRALQLRQIGDAWLVSTPEP